MAFTTMAACARAGFWGASGALVKAKTAGQTRAGCEQATATTTMGTTTRNRRRLLTSSAWKRPNSSIRSRLLTSSALSTDSEEEVCRRCSLRITAFKARQAEGAPASNSSCTRIAHRRKGDRMMMRRGGAISLNGNWRCRHPSRSLSPSSPSSFSPSLSFRRSPLVYTGALPSFSGMEKGRGGAGENFGFVITRRTGHSKEKKSFERSDQHQKRGGRVVNVRAGRIKFSSSLAVDIPIREYPEVSFDQYILDRPRVFHAMFPDRSRSQRLDEETWRIFMLPITFIFMSARPVVDMRIWNEDPSSFNMAIARRAGIVNGAAKKAAHSLCLQATRCKLEGLDYMMKPSDFILGVNGVLFADRSSGSTRLRGSVSLSVDLGSIPASIASTPQPLLEGFVNMLVKQLLETMKTKVNERLIRDYARYAREKSQRTGRTWIGIHRT